ncbi:uncharacterized protein [Ptychodera flava]|uniref:uncharacterized protein n=1 Tax=Ptychodera flava TaxID=63121 RepID=UPI003969F284
MVFIAALKTHGLNNHSHLDMFLQLCHHHTVNQLMMLESGLNMKVLNNHPHVIQQVQSHQFFLMWHQQVMSRRINNTNKKPLMPTIRAEAELEFVDEKVEETAHPIEEQRQQIELLKDKNEELFELQKKEIMTGTSPDLVKKLGEACIMFKARLDVIADCSLLCMLSFLSEENIDYFWWKYKAADVEEVISGILITPEMRSLAEKAGCSIKVRLKIDEKEVEIVKEILHDISAVYTFSKKTLVRTVAFNEWERYILNHVHENQAEYLIQQSRFHPILSELRVDEFFFPSFVSYWYENMYNLPSTLTEATEYAIKHHVQLYCKEHQLEFGNVWDLVQDRLYEIGKQAFDNYPQTPSSFLQFDDSCDSTFLFDLLNDVKRYHISCFLKKPLHSVHIWRQHIYFYALALYLSKSKNALLRRATFEKCVKSIPNILIFVAGILKEKSTFFFILLTYSINKACQVDIELLSLLGGCLSESKCSGKFIGIVQHLMKPQSLDLSTSDFDHISHYCLESIASMLEQTSIVEKLVLVAKMKCQAYQRASKITLNFRWIIPTVMLNSILTTWWN